MYNYSKVFFSFKMALSHQALLEKLGKETTIVSFNDAFGQRQYRVQWN